MPDGAVLVLHHAPCGRGVSGRAALELAYPCRFLGDETHKTPELHPGANQVSGRPGQVIPSRCRAAILRPPRPSLPCETSRPGMSPRPSVLLGPTSAERRDLDTDRGRDRREELLGEAGRAEGVGLRLPQMVQRPPLPLFLRGCTAGVSPGCEDVGGTSV